MDTEWKSWFQLASPEVFASQSEGALLETGNGHLDFRGPSGEVLHAVLDSVTTSSSALDSPPVHRVIVADWRWLLGRDPDFSWPSPSAVARGATFSARAEITGNALSFTNLRDAITIWAIRDPGDVRWHRPEFVRPLLSPLLEGHGLIPAHGATLGGATDGVLLTNRGGSGKSTLTVAGVLRGLTTSGDDFQALRLTPSGVSSIPLFSSAKLAPTSPIWDQVSGLSSAPKIEGKHVVRLAGLAQESPMATHRLRAIVVPFQGTHSVLREATTRQILSALVPGSIGLAEDPHSMIRELGRLAEELPGYWLEVGDDLDSALDALTEINR